MYRTASVLTVHQTAGTNGGADMDDQRPREIDEAIELTPSDTSLTRTRARCARVIAAAAAAALRREPRLRNSTASTGTENSQLRQ
jgi:hypothetical protein